MLACVRVGAKYAEAFLTISLAVRSSLFSLSSALSLFLSSLFNPDRAPASQFGRYRLKCRIVAAAVATIFLEKPKATFAKFSRVLWGISSVP